MAQSVVSSLNFGAKHPDMILGTGSTLGLTDATFTIEVWISLDAEGIAQKHNYFLGASETTLRRGLHLGFQDGRPHFGFYQADLTGRQRLEPGPWYHVAWVYDRTLQEQRIYINGLLDGRRSSASSYLGTGPVSLGRFTPELLFRGSLRELRVWSIAKTSEELQKSLYFSLSGTEPGLTAFWPLDEGEGALIHNCSAPGLVASLQSHGWEALPSLEALPTFPPFDANAGPLPNPDSIASIPAQSTSQSPPASEVTPIPALGASEAQVVAPRRAVFRPGQTNTMGPGPAAAGNTIVTIPDVPALHITSDQTIELWIRPDQVYNESYLWMKAYAAEGAIGIRNGMLFYRWGSKDGNRGNPGEDFQEVTGGRLFPNVWSHIAVVRDVTRTRTVTLFINGQPVASDPTRFDASGSSTLPLLLGGWDAYLYVGAMAEVRLWQRALNPVEVLAMAQALPAPDAPGLVAWWPLTETPDGIVLNRVARLNDLKLSGIQWLPGTPPLSADHRGALRLMQPSDALLVPRFNLFSEQGGRIEFWIRTTSHDPAATLLSVAHPGGNWSLMRPENLTLVTTTNPSGPRRQSQGATREDATGFSIQDGRWHLICLRWRKRECVCLLVDGQSFTFGAEVKLPLATTATLSLGVRLSTAEKPLAETALTCEVSELRIWSPEADETLSTDPIIRPARPFARGLTAVWPLDQRDGKVALELVGQRHALVAGQWSSGLALREYKPALLLQGPARVSAAVPSRKDASQTFTLEAWVCPQKGLPGQTSPGPLLSRWTASSGWELRCDTEQAAFVIGDGSQQMLTLQHGAGTSWIHLAGVYDGNRMTLYINGLRCLERDIGGIRNRIQGPILIGQSSLRDVSQFQGFLSELRIWDSARSAQEIQRHLFHRITGEEPGLMAVWSCDSLEKDQLKDGGPQALHATLFGCELLAADAPLSSAALEPLPQDLMVLLRELKRDRAELRETSRQQDIQLSQLDARLNQLTGAFLAVSQEKEQLTSLHSELESQLSSLQKDNQRLKQERDEFEKTLLEDRAQVSLQDLIKRSNDEVTRAREVLEQQGGSYRLGRVALELKMVPGMGGIGLNFPSLEDLKGVSNSSQLSTLNLSFDPKDTGDQSQTAQRMLPNVKNLTEGMARRKLSEAGYLVEVCYQVLETSADQHRLVDRVISQLPPAQTPLQPGATVTLFLGKMA